jgi:hypothetical protein
MVGCVVGMMDVRLHASMDVLMYCTLCKFTYAFMYYMYVCINQIL